MATITTTQEANEQQSHHAVRAVMVELHVLVGPGEGQERKAAAYPLLRATAVGVLLTDRKALWRRKPQAKPSCRLKSGRPLARP